MQTRHPTKADAFRALKLMGFPVESVIDVGVLSCTTDLMQAFPDIPHFLVEPIEEFHPRIETIYQEANINYQLVKAAAASTDGTAMLKTSSVRDGVDITHARLTEVATTGGALREVKSMTIETLVKTREPAKPFLLKIDVDGAELDILRGAVPVLPACSVLCLEVGLANLAERCNAAITLGFELFDIVDLCYYDGRFVQADYIFINSQMVENLDLGVYSKGFDIEKWSQYSPTPAAGAQAPGGVRGRLKRMLGG